HCGSEDTLAHNRATDIRSVLIARRAQLRSWSAGGGIGTTPTKNFALTTAGAELRLAKRRVATGQVRRRVRAPRADLCRHRHRALDLVAPRSAPSASGGANARASKRFYRHAARRP